MQPKDGKKAGPKREGTCFGNYETQNPFRQKNEEANSKIERVTGVRGKKERENLTGYACNDCAKFYSALEEDGTGEEMCKCVSKHKSNLPPTNYFSGFSQEFGFDD